MNKNTLRLSVVGLCIIGGAFVDEAPPADIEAFASQCWEDEVVVEVVYDPYELTRSQYGCVPADDLPVSGMRPDGHNTHTWDSETNTVVHE